MNEILSSPRIDFQRHPHRSVFTPRLEISVSRESERERERGGAQVSRRIFPRSGFRIKSLAKERRIGSASIQLDARVTQSVFIE